MNSFYTYNAAMLVLSMLQRVLWPRTDAVPTLLDPVLGMLAQWRSRSRSRRELASLDEYQLRDLGIAASQAAFESGKFFLQD